MKLMKKWRDCQRFPARGLSPDQEGDMSTSPSGQNHDGWQTNVETDIDAVPCYQFCARQTLLTKFARTHEDHVALSDLAMPEAGSKAPT